MQYSQCPACNAWCKVQDLAILATTIVLTEQMNKNTPDNKASLHATSYLVSILVDGHVESQN